MVDVNVAVEVVTRLVQTLPLVRADPFMVIADDPTEYAHTVDGYFEIISVEIKSVPLIMSS